MESRIMVQVNLFAGEEQTYRCREQTCEPRLGEGEVG